MVNPPSIHLYFSCVRMRLLACFAGLTSVAIALRPSGERDGYCKINYIYLVDVADFRNL